MSHPLRACVTTLLTAAALLVAAPAHAERIPETLAARGHIGVAAVTPAFPIDYVGVFWDIPRRGESHAHAVDGGHGHAAAPHGEIRLRHGARWGAWMPLVEDGAQAPGRWTGSLVAANDADGYQVRGVPQDAIRPQAVAINTTDGPAREIRTGPAAAQALPSCVSRYDWGADETLGTKAGRAYADVQVMTVHHTATVNDDTDPKATVRAIHRYHTVDNGWDDIGYNYLIDESGRLYEGRWSGADSDPCESDPATVGTAGMVGTGSDFAHDAADQLVTGAHSGGYNTGNIGVALLGDFRDHKRFGADPNAAAIASLEDTLAELGTRHGFTSSQLRGDETLYYDNGVNQKWVYAISGHRDFTSTECPGQRLYDRFPTIRQNVAAKVDSGDGGTTDPGETAPEGTIHVGRLTDSSTDAPGPNWDATVDILAHDGDTDPHQPASNVTVSGTWGDGSTASCTTGGDGSCRVAVRMNEKKVTATTFTVTGLSRAGDTYDAAANHDPEGLQPAVTLTRP